MVEVGSDINSQDGRDVSIAFASITIELPEVEVEVTEIGVTILALAEIVEIALFGVELVEMFEAGSIEVAVEVVAHRRGV
jgi:hypothetical protein